MSSERIEPPSVDNLAEARRAIEAMLLVSNDPTPVQLLAQLIELPVDVIQAMCQELAAEYEDQRRGFQLVEVAGGWRYQTHPDTHAYVERFALEGIPNRLSSAALETLAIVAYKQPISRAQIGAIRGVNVDGVLRTLVQRGYVDEQGRDDGPGQATLFGTTPFFLEQLGLMSLDDLPPLGDFVPSAEVLEALENTLRVEGEPAAPPATGDGAEAQPEANGASMNEPAVDARAAENGDAVTNGHGAEHGHVASNGQGAEQGDAVTNGHGAENGHVASNGQGTGHGVGPANGRGVDNGDAATGHAGTDSEVGGETVAADEGPEVATGEADRSGSMVGPDPSGDINGHGPIEHLASANGPMVDHDPDPDAPLLGPASEEAGDLDTGPRPDVPGQWAEAVVYEVVSANRPAGDEAVDAELEDEPVEPDAESVALGRAEPDAESVEAAVETQLQPHVEVDVEAAAERSEPAVDVGIVAVDEPVEPAASADGDVELSEAVVEVEVEPDVELGASAIIELDDEPFEADPADGGVEPGGEVDLRDDPADGAPVPAPAPVGSETSSEGPDVESATVGSDPTPSALHPAREVAAGPEVMMTPDPPASDASGVGDTRFPGAAEPIGADPLRLDPDQGSGHRVGQETGPIQPGQRDPAMEEMTDHPGHGGPDDAGA